jgi:hypothetical protein
MTHDGLYPAEVSRRMDALNHSTVLQLNNSRAFQLLIERLPAGLPFDSSSPIIPIPTYSLQSLEHNNRVTANDLVKSASESYILFRKEHTTMPSLTFSPPSFSSTASSSTMFRNTCASISIVQWEECEQGVRVQGRLTS